MNALPERRAVSVLTQTLVDPADPAFRAPSKPIGPIYDEKTAGRIGAERGWIVKPDGSGFRRVVASPAPRAILEEDAIRLLHANGVIVICAGGGGVPVVREASGYAGVEAVVDKDRTSAVLADALNMDALLMLSDIDGVYAGWQTSKARRIPRISPGQIDTNDFAAGSMRPKIEAGLAFAAERGRFAAIGSLTDAVGLLNGTAGTRIERP
jgi:carbamate kinase